MEGELKWVLVRFGITEQRLEIFLLGEANWKWTKKRDCGKEGKTSRTDVENVKKEKGK